MFLSESDRSRRALSRMLSYRLVLVSILPQLGSIKSYAIVPTSPSKYTIVRGHLMHNFSKVLYTVTFL